LPIMENYLADRLKKVDASGIRKVFALAATLDEPINFSIGQPDFDVPEPLKEEAIKAILQGYNKYCQTAGDPLLRERISSQLKIELGWEKPCVIVTSGVCGGLLLAFLALVNPGDEVIIPDPYFVAYKHIVNMLGARPVFVDSYPDFDLPIEKIAKQITEKTKLIVLNSPCNPTGRVYSEQRLKALAELAAGAGIIILADEIYEKYCYDCRFSSIASFYKKTLVLRGFSKSYGMPGWRLGYAAAEQCLGELIEQMAKLQQYTFVCAPRPFQKAALAALDYDVSELVDGYRKKRDLVYEGLKDKFEFIRPEGAFYAFLKSPLQPASNFVERAIKNNVLIIPGNVFSERDTHFRISYATSEDKIRQGIEILRSLV